MHEYTIKVSVTNGLARIEATNTSGEVTFMREQQFYDDNVPGETQAFITTSVYMASIEMGSVSTS
jgi:hypothetical protein